MTPTAELIHRPSEPPLEHGAFYRFVPIADPLATAYSLRLLAGSLLGSIVVAPEGVNGVVAGTPEALDSFESALAGDHRFAGLVLQRSACRTPPFARLAVHCRRELVSLGGASAGFAVTAAPLASATPNNTLAPRDWRRLIGEPDVVVIDNRNSFEFRLGHFRSAHDPGVSRFRDFPRYLSDHAAGWKEAGQRVAMYCTGGIRCEKTSAWMRQALGLDVYQLRGGILNYFRQMPDAERDWQGECFVFDNRIALDTRLQETATRADDVCACEPGGEWRLARARRLDAAA